MTVRWDWDEQAALARREEERDHAEHLVRMLRVTLTERAARAYGDADTALLARIGPFEATTADYNFHKGRANAYRDVLSLLGPEEPERYDPNEPF